MMSCSLSSVKKFHTSLCYGKYRCSDTFLCYGKYRCLVVICPASTDIYSKISTSTCSAPDPDPIQIQIQAPLQNAVKKSPRVTCLADMLSVQRLSENSWACSSRPDSSSSSREQIGCLFEQLSISQKFVKMLRVSL